MLDEFEKEELRKLRRNYELCGLEDRAQSPGVESIIRMVQLEMKEREPESEINQETNRDAQEEKETQSRDKKGAQP